MGNKIATEADYWMCSGGIMPINLQSAQITTTEKSGDKYLIINDTSTSPTGDFICAKMIILAAMLAVIIAALTVVTFGAALVVMVALGAIVGSLLCGQKAAIARLWIGQKADFMIAGQKTLTSGSQMTCSIFGSVIKHAPKIKNWWDALCAGATNLVSSVLIGVVLGEIALVAWPAIVELAAGGVTIGWPSISAVLSGNFLGAGGALRALFGMDSVMFDYYTTEDPSVEDGLKSFGNAAVPEVGATKRICTGEGTMGDYLMLLLHATNFLKVKTPPAGGMPKAEPEPAAKADEAPAAPKVVDEAAPTAETKGGGDGKAYEKGGGKVKKVKLQSGTPEHKAARWAEYHKKFPDKLTYEKWSNKYDANMKNPGKGNKSADAYQEEIGWGEREVPMRDANGKIVRKLDIGDVEAKKAIEVKDFESQEVGYSDKKIKAEVEFDKKLVEDGWDVEWVFKDKGPSKPLEEALSSPPPIRIKIIKK